jgi:magnesium transporter
MLRLFGPGCPPNPIDVHEAGLRLDSAVWLDLCQPTRDEEMLAERLIGTNVPTRAEMQEIEPSSRLYERDGVAFMTMSVLYGIDQGHPATDPISFILTKRHLVTVRYVEPRPFIAFVQHAHAEHQLTRDPATVLIRLLDAIVDREADELENVGRELEAISNDIFERRSGRERNPEGHYEALMLRIGKVQRLLSRARESSVSASRMLGFLSATERMHDEKGHARHLRSMIDDAHALDDHSDFLAENLNFLLDAAMGMISLEQKFVMKIVSVVAVVLMPPTLIAGIYGMNFHRMPELSWMWGYPWAIGLMLVSAIGPYWFARRRGWL